MESHKKRKSSKGQDMISNLPDFIIGRILSFLPTKYAVRTSVLSKNWTYKWTFITNLNFRDRVGYSSKIVRKIVFLSFVYRVLLHLNSSSIQSFSLDLFGKYESLHVDQWISAVVSRRVKKLWIKLYLISNKDQALPSHFLLRYRSLEELVLKVERCDIKVPTSALFPSLTLLKLSGIQFIGGPSNESGNVQLDFPVLRTYKTDECTWSSSLKCVTLEAPLLKVVSIENFRRRSASNNSYTVLKFCVSSLAEFTYKGYLLPETIVFDLSAAHIASAKIEVDIYEEEISVQENVALSSKLLKQFHNVEFLKFGKSEKKGWLAKDSLKDLPSFEMLSHVKLRNVIGETLLALLFKTPNLKTLIFQVFPQLAKDSLADLPTFKRLSQLNLGKVTGEILLALLPRTPNLKALIFVELLQFDQEQLNYDCVPDCFSTTLQVVKYLSFDGFEHELSFAKFVMENVVA
ncbi:putative FBD-associated F-box protein At5g56690 [Lotus japonicus]|uniref:putative FBD-associated F-box protein At5g56690 n=1 Tax=Lotus japonicus TaxID=34305 RepID=UPI002583F1AF|nr:putative FBD-associated F-box protein At5g56690 [Lotus japonicus]